MGTCIRPEVSKNNKYWISKHRHYELKHFCLQYPEWKRAYVDLQNNNMPVASIERLPVSNLPNDPTAIRAIVTAYYKERIDLIEKVAMEADKYLFVYILKGVTEELSYPKLKAKYKIPCGRDMYYDRYRRFFWLLSEARN